jgi:serine/threonine protein kinase
LGTLPEEMIEKSHHKEVYFTDNGHLKGLKRIKKDDTWIGLFNAIHDKTKDKNIANQFVDIVFQLLRLKPEERPTADKALKHPLFVS